MRKDVQKHIQSFLEKLRHKQYVNMNLSQVDLNKGELVIINTKSRKERLVPLIGRAKDDLEEYILEGRYWFTLNHAQVTYRDKKLNNAVKDALILNQKGGRLTRGFYDRLNILKQRSNIQKPVTPHLLRHSIATHLMAAGMKIEDIKDFLGHQSLESTQVYIHLAHNYEKLADLA